MTATNGQARPSMLAELVAELERHGDGRPAEIARLGPSWNEHTILDALAELFAGGVVGLQPRHRAVVGRMTGLSDGRRAVRACRSAGIPVVEEQACTCQLHGKLVVLATPEGLEVVWPYNRSCPVHDLPRRGLPAGRPRGRSRQVRPRARGAMLMREAGAR